MLKQIKFVFVAGLVLLLTVLLSYPQKTSAASLTALSDTMSRLKVNTLSNHTIKYTTPTGVAAGQYMTITMPTGFTIGSVDYTDIDVSWGPSTGAENELTLGATASGTTWGAAFAGQVLTITSGSGTITAASKVIVEIGTNATAGATGDQQINNNVAAATYVISIAGTFGDTGSVAIVTLTNEQVTVTASVDPTISFSLTGNSTAFGTLTVGSIVTAGTNISFTVGTNANNGYSVTVQDAGGGGNPGLWNASASAIIGSADASYNSTADLSSVSVGYGLQATCTAGCTTGTDINTRWRQGSNTVGGLTIAPTTLVSYASAMSADHTVQVVHKAKISAYTKAGSYSDTLTYVATGNF